LLRRNRDALSTHDEFYEVRPKLLLQPVIGKKVVAFVVDEEDGGKVGDFDLADGFCAEFFNTPLFRKK